MKLFKRNKKETKSFNDGLDIKCILLYRESWVRVVLNTRTNMLELITGFPGSSDSEMIYRLPIFLEMNRYHLSSWIQSTNVPFTKNLENVCGEICDKVTLYIKDAMVSKDKLIYAEEVEKAAEDNHHFNYSMDLDPDIPSCVTKATFNIPKLDWVIEHRGRNPYNTVAKDINVYFTATIYEPEPELYFSN